MKNLSIGLNIALQFAEAEAKHTHHYKIEKEHLFLGLCSLKKMLKPGVLPRDLDSSVENAIRLRVLIY